MKNSITRMTSYRFPHHSSRSFRSEERRVGQECSSRCSPYHEKNQGFAFTLGLTTAVELIVVMLFTHPMMKLLVRTKFFGGGHRLSGLDPVHLGANVAAYAGRGKTRSVPEREKIKAGADTRTIAERRAEQARLDAEAAAADSASDSTSTTDAASSDGFVDASVSSDSSEDTR